MTEKQPLALRLADALQQQAVWEGHYGPSYLRDLLPEAAAELRRLSAENESLRQIVQDFPPVEAELREVSDRAHRLETQRDALLEALAVVLLEAEHTLLEPTRRKARAAIKAVEGDG